MIRVVDDIFIDDSEIKEEFIRSGGPGGQHVNKVSTAVQLRFDIKGSKLPQDIKERLIRLGGRRVTDDGTLIISSRGFRKRELNRTDAVDKLIALIRKACERPKRRVKTKPSRAKREKRIEEKKARGGTKKMRRKVSEED
ncbi:MAG: aminoacyl-tRNA hydrolase [Deltaproteobacteria bacterium]|nr:aminoacyl-tRNA hydrolase [Deltaproteobacteria bacterium]